ncbi:MAG: LytTR family DNA-binding domain-containing protein [Bacteroidota bacterium]
MIKAIIVDDEPLARSIIQEFIDDYEDIEVIAECANGREALKCIDAEKPDLLFLDIQMPGLTGFDVIEQLTYLPQIIFSTANDAFAIDAFETGAIDYLLKPYNKARFDRAVQRVLKHQHVELEQETMRHFLASIKAPASFASHLFVRVAEKIFPVATNDVLWIEAAGDYSNLHTSKKTFVSGQGIGALEKRLDPALFVRVHRSAIVALSAIAHIVSDGEGGYHVTLRNRERVRVSRSYAARVRDRIV